MEEKINGWPLDAHRRPTPILTMTILGISCFYHDAAVVLLKDGILVAAAEEERFSRKKHDADFPSLAIAFVLRQGGIASNDVDWVVFYEKPFPKFERILLTILATYPQSWRVFYGAMREWLLSKLWVKSMIIKKLDLPLTKILFSDHHLSHAASAFYPSPFDKATIVTIDGVGEWTTATIGLGEGTQIKLLKEMRFPHSLGLLYSTFTAFLGFEVNDGEYKVMGMAPYGKPKYIDRVKKVLTIHQDGSIHLDLSYFAFHRTHNRSFSGKFVQLFGKSRDPKSLFFTRQSGFPTYFGEQPENFEELAKVNEHYADIAASIQAVTEEIIEKIVKHAIKLTGERRVCLAGGVALNSVANGKLVKKRVVRDLYIQPAAGDGGGALGAALWAYHALLDGRRKMVMNHASFGQSFSRMEILSFLRSNKIRYREMKRRTTLLTFVADALIEKKVVGWFQGRFEWGPRALGYRSILADPRDPNMKDIVNTKIKFREPYRPFAPSVLSEHTERWFDLSKAAQWMPARFMLLVVPVKKDKRKKIPAITHVDGSGRLQIVFRDTNPLYYDLIQTFYKKTGVPLVLNTSFNLKGEPIVTTPENAYNTFMKSGMDLLVLENFLVTKT